MGYCLNEGGIVLDLSLMNTCHIDHDRMLIHMDGGLICKDVYYKYLKDKRNIVIGGQCPFVGVSGFTSEPASARSHEAMAWDATTCLR